MSPFIRRTLYVAIGLPGCGKTTFINEKYPNIVRLSADDIQFAALGYPRSGVHHDKAVREMAYDMLKLSVRKLLMYGDVFLDGTYLVFDRRKPFLDIARSLNARRVAVLFPPDLPAALKRNAERGRMVPEAVIREFFTRYEPPREGEFDEIVKVEMQNGDTENHVV